MADATPPSTPAPRGSLRAVLRYLPRYRARLFTGAAALVVGQLLLAYAPQLLRRAVGALDRDAAGFDAGTAPGVALHWAFLYVAAMGVRGIANFAMRVRLIGLSRLVERDLKRDVFGRLMDLPVPFFDRMRTGDLLSRLTSDVEAVRFSVGPGVMYLAQTAIAFPAALNATVSMNVRISRMPRPPAFVRFSGAVGSGSVAGSNPGPSSSIVYSTRSGDSRDVKRTLLGLSVRRSAHLGRSSQRGLAQGTGSTEIPRATRELIPLPLEILRIHMIDLVRTGRHGQGSPVAIARHRERWQDERGRTERRPRIVHRGRPPRETESAEQDRSGLRGVGRDA